MQMLNKMTNCVICEQICTETCTTCQHLSYLHSTAGVKLDKTSPQGPGLCSSTTWH